MTHLTAEDLAERLPHGPSAVELDQFTWTEPGSGQGTRTYSADHPAIRDHFPGNPLVPGHLLLETMAQAAGLAAADPEESDRTQRLLVAARDVKWTAPLRPGVSVTVYATCTAVLGNLLKADVRVISPDETLIARAELTLAKADA
jgi:3-hydroxyacyl-[acyl-carrier-protein] dehydratase